MKKLRYSEAFYSIQGEGKFIGVPSVFLRTFGCNFRCKSFCRSDTPDNETINPDVQVVIDNIDKYKTMEELPLVRTGCDTYASIYPQFKHLMKDATVDEVVEHVCSLLPESGKWLYNGNNDVHLIITGGEPLLGWQQLYPELINHKRLSSVKNITFETNGTQMLHSEFKSYIKQSGKHITWSVSPKLSESGESWDNAINPDVLFDYVSIENSDMYLKFVVVQESNLEEVKDAVHAITNQVGFPNVPVYLMPAGGCVEEYTRNAPIVAKLAMDNGFRYSPREHLTLFKNSWGT